jgi:integrase
MFRGAVREGLLLASPAAALEKLPEDDSTEKEVFTLAEVSQLVEAAGSDQWQKAIFNPRKPDPDLFVRRSLDWQGMILVGFYAGARLGDCARLMWSNIDLERRAISFMPAKTSRKKKRLEIPIHARLFNYLTERATSADQHGALFPSLHETGVAGKLGLSGHFKAITTAAGIDARTVRPAQRNNKGLVIRRSVQAKTFHSLRHSLTSSLANLDVSEEIRRRIVGHESADVHAKYTHTERETLARAIDRLPLV